MTEAAIHDCAAGCGATIPDPPATFPRTPATLYCSDDCRRQAGKAALKRSYRRHRARRIADTQAWQASHYDRYRANTKRSQVANPEREAIASRKSRLKLRFGLELSDYEAMLEEQGGRCAICREPERRLNRRGAPKALSIDHDHETGEVRGLLCQDCNHALGWLERFSREPGWQFAAMAYLTLDKPQEVS